VCGGVWWCVVVCGGVWWCVVVGGGVGWWVVGGGGGGGWVVVGGGGGGGGESALAMMIVTCGTGWAPSVYGFVGHEGVCEA